MVLQYLFIYCKSYYLFTVLHNVIARRRLYSYCAGLMLKDGNYCYYSLYLTVTDNLRSPHQHPDMAGDQQKMGWFRQIKTYIHT